MGPLFARMFAELQQELSALGHTAVLYGLTGVRGAAAARRWAELRPDAVLSLRDDSVDEGGSALADLLLGAAAPSGKLAETIPLRHEDNPAFGNFPGDFGRVHYGEGLLIGYRWYDTRRMPVAYPFGHGLSYTTFSYDDVDAVVRSDGAEPEVEVTVTVTNTGDRPGTETVQLYVTDPESTVSRPAQELRAFARVALEPGESSLVTLALGRRAFAFWSETLDRWVVEGGTFGLRVGASSRDIRLETAVALTGDDIALPLRSDSPAEDWLSHRDAGPWLREAVGDQGFGAILFDPHNGQMIRAIPLRRLSRFPGFPLSEEQIEEGAARFAGASPFARIGSENAG